jgi:hypothetical protein
VAPSASRVQVRHWALVALAALVTFFVWRPAAYGVLLGGGAIGLSTFLYAVWFGIAVRRGSPRLAIGILFVKLAAFLGLGWLVFSSGEYRPDPMGFALGVSCLPTAAVWEAVRTRKE